MDKGRGNTAGQPGLRSREGASSIDRIYPSKAQRKLPGELGSLRWQLGQQKTGPLKSVLVSVQKVLELEIESAHQGDANHHPAKRERQKQQ